MAFKDYSTVPASNTALADGTYVGPNMLRNKVRPAVQQIMVDGKLLANDVVVAEANATAAVATANAASVLATNASNGNLATQRIGTATLFGYPDNDIMRIYRDGGQPASIQHTFRVVSSGKGDNTTYRGVTNAYFEYRDRDDMVLATKGVGYALHLSVVPRFARNNVPFDDIACLAMGNTTGTVGAKGTDCVYISENLAAFPLGEPEWYSLFTSDAGADVGIQMTGKMASGKVARFGNAVYITFRNAAGSADANAIGVTNGNVLEVGDATQIARIDMKAPTNFVSTIIASLGNFANDAAAATGGISVGQFYRNGSAVQVRVA